MVENKVIETIKRENLISRNDKIIVALSGGPDSVCLLHILSKLSKEYGVTIYAAHLNHQIRGTAAHKDALYAMDLCAKLGIRYFVKSLDVPTYSKENKLSLEEGARILRYEMLFELKNELSAHKIAVAHNLDDQAETVIMRIMRGTGLTGLKGMEYKRPDGIIRPLMDVLKKNIETYCRVNELHPRIDHTNLEDEYTRNKIRIHLLPYIQKEYAPNIKETLSRMANGLREDSLFIENIANEKFEKIASLIDDETVRIDLDLLESEDVVITKRIIRNAYKHIEGSYNGLETVHLDDVIELIQNQRKNAKINLPKGIIADKKSSYLYLTKKEIKNEPIEYEIEIPINKITIVEELGIRVEVQKISKEKSKMFSTGSSTKSFDIAKVSGKLIIRNRRNGDKIKPLGLGGTKKIKDILIDSKVPLELRNNVPLICDDEKILWIVGHCISEEAKISELTEEVFRISIKDIKH
ncbi:MAG: tRNA lysidine(34) synthetase TilS [Proteocatella sp.]